jgi:hypothetical protein
MTRLALALFIVLLSLPWPSSAARAEDDGPSDSERAAAQVLFDDARVLMKSESYDQACEKFAESYRLHAALGTQLNLANCYGKIGRTASSWINFVEAATRAQQKGQQKRFEVATERAAELEKRLSKLKIVVSETHPGLTVTRGGDSVGAAQWGISLPVDPGKHLIKATAPGRRPWKKTVTVGDDADRIELTVPPLRAAPVAETPKPKEAPQPESDEGDDSEDDESGDDGDAQRAGGFVAGAIGIVGVGIGVAFGVLAMTKHDDSLEFCEPGDDNRCTADGVALRDDALTFAHVSTAGLVVGGVGVVLGIVLVATAPSSDADGDDGRDRSGLRILPKFDPTDVGSSGILIEGRF